MKMSCLAPASLLCAAVLFACAILVAGIFNDLYPDTRNDG